MRRAVAALVLLLVLPMASACQKPAATAPPAAESSTSRGVPDGEGGGVRLQILSYDGIQSFLESKRGKVVVVDAWSTACPPCMKEFHRLVELNAAYPAERLACVSLSFDYEGIGKVEDVRKPVLEFLTKQQAYFDNLLCSEPSDEMFRKFDVTLPTVMVYDRTGKLRKKFDNTKAKSAAEAFTYDQVRSLVDELLGES